MDIFMVLEVNVINRNLFWSGFIFLLLVSGCGWKGTPTRNNDITPLTSIEIIAVSQTIAAHTSTNLSVKGNFSGLYTRDVTDQVTWSSGTPAVAGFITTASPSRVTGIIPGATVLTATVGSVTAISTLTVSSASLTALTITPAAPTVSKGLTYQFIASGTFSDSTIQDLTYDAAWASSDTAVATVSDAVADKGFAKAIAVGVSTISVTFGSVTGTALLTVSEPVLQSITITPANPSLLSLSTSTWSFQATGNYSNGTTADITSQAAWVSSSPGIASIASTGGTTTAVAKGSTTISATLPGVSGVSGTTVLTVTGGDLTGITVSPAAPNLVKGTVARVTVTGTFDNGSTRDITRAVVWSPANTALATVTTADGNLAWLNALDVTPTSTPTIITAKVTGKSGTLTVASNLTVTSPTLQTLAFSPTNFGGPIAAGTSTRFAVAATFAGGLTQDVTSSAAWSSSAGTTATVGDSGLSKGRVSGLAAGSTTISAAYGGLTVTAPVTVTVPTTLLSTGISVIGGLIPGNQVKYIATAFNGQDVTEDTTWSIDSSNIAILADSQNQPGQIVGVDKGTTTLRATFGVNTPTTSVTVQ
jgi:hypothetical protein